MHDCILFFLVESLEEKIKHFAKRKRIEVIKENNS